MSQRKHGRDIRRKAAAERSATQRSTDIGVFAAVIMVGGFGLLLWYLMDNRSFPHAVVGFVVAVLGLMNYSAFRAYLGRPLPGWQQTFARVPLRFAGFGTRTGKPLEAAHSQVTARNAVVMSVVFSAVIVLVLAIIMIPELRR